MAPKSKSYDELNFKERLVHCIHNDLSFGCNVLLKEDAFHTCEECKRRVRVILEFLTYELGVIRSQKI